MAKPVDLELVRAPPAEHPDLALEPALPARVLEVVAQRAARGVGGAMATILEAHGAAAATPGQKLWVGADGSRVGTVGGGDVERELLRCLSSMATADVARHEVKTVALPEPGGRVVALLEPIAGLVPCLVVGGGHIATCTAPLLSRVGFAVTVVDAREAWGQQGRIPGATCVVGDFDDVGDSLPGAPGTSVCLVMTHDHGLDQRAIEWAIRRGFAFVGGVGSRAKAQRTRDRLTARGFPEADVARVRMPLGVDIGARLPDEIAASITAEMIAWRRSRSVPQVT